MFKVEINLILFVYGKITVGWRMHHPLGQAHLEVERQEDSEENAAVMQE